MTDSLQSILRAVATENTEIYQFEQTALREAADHIETLEAALRTIQSAVPKYLKKEMTAEEFIDAVLAAADDPKVVRTVRASGASPER